MLKLLSEIKNILVGTIFMHWDQLVKEQKINWKNKIVVEKRDASKVLASVL